MNIMDFTLIYDNDIPIVMEKYKILKQRLDVINDNIPYQTINRGLIWYHEDYFVLHNYEQEGRKKVIVTSYS